MKPLRFYLHNNKNRPLPGARQKGFTLIEVIVSIVIMGILAVFMSTGIARIIQGYLFSRDNAETTLKSQVALARITKELRSVDAVTSGTKTAITYSYLKDGTLVYDRTLSWSGTDTDPVRLGNQILVDNVNDFEITYHTGYNDPGDHAWNGTETMIGITLKLNGAAGHVSSFTTRLLPRNL